VNVRDVEDAKRSAKLTGLQIRVIDELGRSPSYCEALADDLKVSSKRLNANLHALERRGHLTTWIVAVPLSTAGIRSVRMWRPLTERERLEKRVDERRNLWLSNRALELMRPRFEPMLELHRMMRERTPKPRSYQRTGDKISASPGA
jgi:DNA-binding MarR family transcriptional regulator